jgi:dephospho-CoA kinase
MSEAKLAAILARQTPDSEKRQRADYVVPTGGTLEETRAAVAEVVRELLRRPGAGRPV